MDFGFILFTGLALFALHWYLKGSALSKEKELRRSLELCFTLDEQYKITREMYRRNLEVPDVLPPLLRRSEDSAPNKRTYFVQEEKSKKFVRLYGDPEDVDEEFDQRMADGTGTTLNPEMYSFNVAPLVRNQSGNHKGQVKIYCEDNGD